MENHKKNFLLVIQLVCIVFSAIAQKSIYHKSWIDLNKNGRKDVYEDINQPIENRVNDLLSQMTIDEKTCQMATLYGYGRVLKDSLPTSDWKNQIWKDGIANIDEHLNGVKSHTVFVSNLLTYPHSNHAKAINIVQKWFVENTRLGIPVDFSNEGIHGLTHDRATPLVAPIAMASTWNKELIYRAGTIVGREAKALGYTNIYAPILDVSRDQRWGRIVETFGEDPYLIGQLGINMVNGIQSKGVVSTIKHFAVYGIPKGGRDGNTRTDPHVAPREMLEMHLYPFRKVIEESHPLGIMSSYNDWDGIPVTGSYYFLTELLRKQFGFKGYIVSDSEAVEFLFTKHHVADSYPDAVKQVVEAGLNVRTNFTPPERYILPLRSLIKSGKIPISRIDELVGDVLRVKFILGLFDHPFVKDVEAADKITNPQYTNDFVLDMASQSFVLLKNENNLLPLNRTRIKRILVTGPLANKTSFLTSRYGPSHLNTVSVLDGIKQFVNNEIIVDFAKGCDVKDKTWPESEIFPTDLTDDEQKNIELAVSKAKFSDVVIAVMGEDETMVGECKTRTSLNLPDRQDRLLRELKKTGKPIVLILVNGHPLSINQANRDINAILETWFSNSLFGQAVAETIFGVRNPGGKLPVTFPKTVGQIELNFPYKPGSQAEQPQEGDNGGGSSQIDGALYPFGYGLSYTTFEYSNITTNLSKQNSDIKIEIYVDVKNTGKCKGDEVVQLYIKDCVSSVTTYEYKLRGFERLSLQPGEVRKVKFILTKDDLSILDKNMKWVVEPGRFIVMIGSSSVDIRISKEFEIQ